MARLGTWTTFDCPEDEAKTREAYEWLKEKVEAIGGEVRKVLNPHDFGMYPSFEIDKPYEFNFMGEDFEDEMATDDDGLQEKYDEFVLKMNAIEDEFSNKFHND